MRALTLEGVGPEVPKHFSQKQRKALRCLEPTPAPDGVAAWCWLLGHMEAGSIPISISSLMMEAGHPCGVQGKGHTLGTVSSTPIGISSCDGICHLLVTYSDKDKAIPGSSSELRQWQKDRLCNSSAGAEGVWGKAHDLSPPFRRQLVGCTLNPQ